eukprot:403361764
MSTKLPKPKSNGFSFPLDPLQIISWLVFSLKICIFYTLECQAIQNTLMRTVVIQITQLYKLLFNCCIYNHKHMHRPN